MSPKKVREVERTIEGRKAADAVDYLMLVPRKSARLIAKTLKSALANAENNNNLSADTLTVKTAIIENGPVLKRFRTGPFSISANLIVRLSAERLLVFSAFAIALLSVFAISFADFRGIRFK